jgi:hypothetical protein
MMVGSNSAMFSLLIKCLNLRGSGVGCQVSGKKNTKAET